MWVAPAMTWLLVSTSPSVEMIMPEPWSSATPPGAPGLGPWASTATTWGRTFCTMAGIDAPPDNAGPGAPFVTATPAGPEPVPSASATAAPTAPPTTAATTATAIQRRPPPGPPLPVPAPQDAGTAPVASACADLAPALQYDTRGSGDTAARGAAPAGGAGAPSGVSRWDSSSTPRRIERPSPRSGTAIDGVVRGACRREDRQAAPAGLFVSPLPRQ